MSETTARIAVTGSTGRLGGRVARLLAEAGVEQRLVVRDPARAPVLPGAHTAVAAYGDHPASVAALEGVETLFMVSASEHPDRRAQHFDFIEAAAEAGVRRVVYVSFYGAAPDATFTLARDHAATEEHLLASGMASVVLRDNLYADFAPFLPGDDGVIRGPAGDGVVAMVAQDDIARAAVAVLSNPSDHDGRRYDLTGPEALSLHQVAAALSAHQGRAVTYHAESVEEAYESRRSYGAPAWQMDAWVSTYTAIAAGELAGVTDDVRLLTGRAPMSLSDVLRGAAHGSA